MMRPQGPFAPPAGWYPDPSAPDLQQRYWNGAAWGPTRAGPGGGAGQRRRGGLLPIVALVGLLVAVGVVMVALTRQDVDSVKIAETEIHFKASRSEIQRNQPEIRRQADAYEQHAREAGESVPEPDVSIEGRWVWGQPGFEWRFAQYGDQVVFQEVSGYGITVVGEGAIFGLEVTLTFLAIDRSRGSIQLTVDGSGSMHGLVVNQTHGIASEILLRKVG